MRALSPDIADGTTPSTVLGLRCYPLTSMQLFGKIFAAESAKKNFIQAWLTTFLFLVASR